MSQTVIDFSQSAATWFAGDGASLNHFTLDASGTGDPDPWTWANLVNSLLREMYDAKYGVALSVKGITGNAAGEVADIAAGSDGHVLRRSGTALAFGTIVAAGIASDAVTTAKILDANVTLPKLANSGARSVVGRSANSSGAVADISGGGSSTAPHVLTDNGTSVAFRALSATDLLASTVIYEVDFTGLANNTLADGAETIDGLAWTAANMAELGTAAVQNGTGIRMVAATSNGGATTMNSTTQAAAYIYTTLSAIPGYDPAHSYIVEVYLSDLVHEASGEGFILFLWDVANSPNTGAAAKFRSANLMNDGSNRILRTVITTTTVSGTEARTGHNVIQIRLNGLGTGPVSSGTWAGSWPVCTTGLVWQTATGAGLDTFSHGAMRLGFALATANDASPTTACTISRMRIRKVG